MEHAYAVCRGCAHFWPIPAGPDQFPDACENCGHPALERCATEEDADEMSEAIAHFNRATGR